MHLSTQRSGHLQRVMELLATPMSGLELRRMLAAPMLGLLDADFYASYLWDESTQRFEQGVALNLSPAHGQRYEREFQFDDPLTPKLLARRLPSRVTDVLPQQDLVETEFFNEFLRPDGLHWGVNTFAHDGFSHLGDMRIWRGRARPNFDDDDLHVLQMIYPALVKALGRCESEISSEKKFARNALTERLVKSAGFSRREAQVAALACEGISDKGIAKSLNIGFTTVRTHLSSAFRKLDCNGRTQLAHRVGFLPSRRMD